LHFIQFDFTSALAAGMMNGQLSVGSIQQGESFAIFGSNVLGTLGTQVSGIFGSAFDDQFVSIAGFGQFNYYSVRRCLMTSCRLQCKRIFPRFQR
jgi:hypothetical protein